MAKKFKHLTDEEYQQIKHLLGLGLSGNQVATVTKRNPGVVSRIRNSKNFSDYLTKTRKYSRDRQEFVPKTDVTVDDRLNVIEKLLRDLLKKG